MLLHTRLSSNSCADKLAIVSSNLFQQGSQKDHGKSPNLEVQTRSCPLLQAELLNICVISVLVDSSNDECTFFFGQKFPCCSVCTIGEIDKQEISSHAENASEDALDDKDPTFGQSSARN